MAAVLLGSCADEQGADDPLLVESYCEYGAVSEAHLEGCIEHVNEEDVRSRDTNASQYAQGDLDECLQDAGPFCTSRD